MEHPKLSAGSAATFARAANQGLLMLSHGLWPIWLWFLGGGRQASIAGMTMNQRELLQVVGESG